jgi:hypothetical protein
MMSKTSTRKFVINIHIHTYIHTYIQSLDEEQDKYKEIRDKYTHVQDVNIGLERQLRHAKDTENGLRADIGMCMCVYVYVCICVYVYM